MSAADTERRRLVQPLWNALDRHVRPVASAGVVLAVSGGPDSRALLEGLARWAGRHDGLFLVASVNHGHRATSGAEARAVVARARALGFAAHAIDLVARGRGEAELRAARYRALFALAAREGAARLCTAHHSDDDAEGFLLDVVGRGGGRHGAGMRADDGAIVRPLLGLSRATLAIARTALGATDVVVDPCDAVGQGERARLRLGTIAALQTVRLDVMERLAGRARRTREDEDCLQLLAEGVLLQDGGVLVVEAAGTRDRAVVRRAIHVAVERLAPRADPRGAGRTVDQILDALCQPGQRHFDLPGVRALVDGGQLTLAPAGRPSPR